MTPDPDFILDAVITGRKPACDLYELSPALIRKAVLSNLERHFYVHDGVRFCIFGLPDKMALPLVVGAAEIFRDTKFIDNIDILIAEIRDLTVVSALAHFIKKFDNSSSSKECAQSQIFIGLLFGYPPRCIQYLLERVYEKKRHIYETKDKTRFYLRCEDCFIKNIWAPWCLVNS